MVSFIAFVEYKTWRLQTKMGRYKPDWGMWMDGINFASSLWTSARADYEVDAGIYEVGLHDMGFFLTFAADYKRNCSGKAAKNVKLL